MRYYLDSLCDGSRIVYLVYLYVVNSVQAEYVVSCRVPNSSAEKLFNCRKSQYRKRIRQISDFLYDCVYDKAPMILSPDVRNNMSDGVGESGILYMWGSNYHP
jgi:hypothetical protein